MIVGQHRGSFPKGAAGETAQAARLRFEAWVRKTHDDIIAADDGSDVGGDGDNAGAEQAEGRHLDPVWRAVVAHPRYSAVSRASKKAAIAARCWECLGCDDDSHSPAGKERIKACGAVACELHSVRPYQPDGSVVPLVPLTQTVAKVDTGRTNHHAKALANPGSRALAVKGYCHSCCGGVHEVNTMQLVRDCTTASCALFEVRPGAMGFELSGSDGAALVAVPQGLQKGFENL